MLPTDWYIEISCTQCSWNASLRSIHSSHCCVWSFLLHLGDEPFHSVQIGDTSLSLVRRTAVVASDFICLLWGRGGGKHRCHPPLGKKKPVKDDVEDSDAVSCGCLWHAHNSSNRRNSVCALCLLYASISVHVFEVWKVAVMRMWHSEEMSRYESI